ncbi:MAG: hypothetical protein IEMM0002_0647 [bacterium]|nr:MAG: hypothetical protein IEMM0002_0647 [bacterium]
MVAVRFILGFVILIFMVTFAVKNMEPEVTIRYYFDYSFGPIPFFFSLLAATVLGMVITAVFSIAEYIRFHTAIRRQRKHINSLEKDLLEFRRQPPEPLAEPGEERPDHVQEDRLQPQ